MNKLAMSLHLLTKRTKTGSFATCDNRERGLAAMAVELYQLGIKIDDARHFKPKHAHALVAYWKEQGIADASIRNRLGWVRWWAEQIGKPGFLPASNDTFGLAERTPYQGNRARRADADTLAGVTDPRIRMALRLERAFGLRREEALKFRPVISDHGTHLALVPSTTKGGRYREIPLTHPAQRTLLDEAHALVGDGSLTPRDTNYRKFLQRYKYQTRAGGLGNAHGLRHGYAQTRYRQMTGWKAPKEGGPTREQMTPEQVERDKAARLQISRELGHMVADHERDYPSRWGCGGFDRGEDRLRSADAA